MIFGKVMNLKQTKKIAPGRRRALVKALID